jgi:hypothetical protein
MISSQVSHQFEEYYASLLHQDPCADGFPRKGLSGQVPNHVMPQTIPIDHFLEFEH